MLVRIQRASGKFFTNQKEFLFTLFSRLSGLTMQFIMGLVIARTLNASGYGAYSLYSAICVLTASFIGIGAPTHSFKAIAQLHEAHQFAHLRSFLLRIMSIVSLVGFFTIALGGLIVSTGITDRYPSIKMVLMYGLLAAIPFTLLRILFEGMQGVGLAARAMFMENNLAPLFMILACGFLILTVGNVQPEYLMLVNAGSFIILTVAMYHYVIKDARSVETKHQRINVINKSMIPIWISTMLDAAILFLPTVLAASYGTLDEVGKFSIAFRFILIAVSFLVIVRGIIGRQLILAYKNENWKECTVLANKMMKFGLLLYLPVFMIFIFLGAELMHLFGKSFLGGEIYLWILSAGQLIYALFGIMGFVLIVMDKSEAEATLAVGSVLFMVIGAWCWRTNGVLAVACAYAVATSVRSILSYVLVKRRLAEIQLNSSLSKRAAT